MNGNSNDDSGLQSRDAIIDAFDALWSAGKRPSLSEFAARLAPHASPADGLRELVLIDLEYRWKDRSFHDRPTIGEYLTRFPELIDPHSGVTALLAEEYRARAIWGDRPTHDAFITQYPDHVVGLVRNMRLIDEQLIIDEQLQPTQFKGQVIAPDPRAPLPYTDYILQKHIGTGGMGRVYVAWQKSLNRRVAVKALRKSRQRDTHAVDAFVREAVIAGRLRHSNIVGIHGLGRFPSGGYFLVMDYIRGADLSKAYSKQTCLPSEAIQLTHQIATAISYAHNQGVVHCDLKPSNVLIDDANHVYLVDFGFARLTGASHHLTDIRGGTWAYLAPEQLNNSTQTIDPRVDVFGIGGILYNLLTGQPPRGTSGQDPRLAAIRPLDSVNRKRASELYKICRRCLADDPDERYASADHLANVLQSTLAK